MERLERLEQVRGWARRLLEWREVGLKLQAEVSAARYFIFAGRYEVVSWAEPRDLGGRRRVEVGMFGTVGEAQAACERDAQRRLRREKEASPVDIRIAPPRRRRAADERPRDLPPNLSACEHPRRRRRAAKLRSWRAAVTRSRTQYLGVVYAPDEKAAEAAAIAEFKIAEDQRRRLIVRPNDD